MAGNHRLNPLIDELIGEHEDGENKDLIAEMIHTCLNLLRDGADRGDLKVLNKALKELRYAFKVFAPYRHLKKVSVFGSARVRQTSPYYQQAVAFGQKIASRGFMVITGAGSGIMEAALEGAGRERSFGVNIRLPFEQEANPIITDDPKLITFKYFFTRKLLFVKETNALVCFPGGFGTMDEVFETLTLMQTGKSTIMPIVLLDAPRGDYWKNWEQLIRSNLLELDAISENDLHLFCVTDDLDQACDEISNFYRVYHSMRQVGDDTVIRLNRPIEESWVDRLTEEFGDILNGGAFKVSPGPLRGETGDPQLQDLHRLVFPFNRRDMGRLRQLIDHINGILPQAQG
jgi:uncharacterized protein (TIGR00730 family)